MLVVLLLAAPARGELTHGAELAGIYDTILAGDFDAARRDLAEACPPAPAEACQAMRVAALWWRITLDPEDRQFDSDLEREAITAIDATGDWTRRRPESAEAWFYHAASYAPLVQWRLLRGQRLAAIREASRVKSSLERALDLAPALDDAHFGIGLYRYYAGIAPAGLRMLRWLFWLPGGNREEGLQQMEAARTGGQLLRAEADYQLHFIYLRYENQPERALDLLESLHDRYPSNPRFLERLAEVQRDYFGDYFASIESWERLIDAARLGAVAVPAVAEVRARLGLAETLDRMSRSDLAIQALAPMTAGRPAAPAGGLARAFLRKAAAYDRLGDRPNASESYRQTLEYAPPGDAGEALRRLAREGLAEPPDAQDAEAYRLAIDGRRAWEEGDPPAAAALLERSVALGNRDHVARYWLARALLATGQPDRGATLLESIVASRPDAPAFVLASAMCDLADLVETRGDTTRATDLYRRAAELRGGAPEARARARMALAQLPP